MIVCHCNRICHRQIEIGCTLVIATQPQAVLTPARVYDALGKRPRCGGCFSLAASLIETCCQETPTACTACPCAETEASELRHDQKGVPDPYFIGPDVDPRIGV